LPPAPTFSTRAAHIDQDVERAMRRVGVAAKLFEQAYREIAPVLKDLAHFSNTILRPCQSSGSAALNDGAHNRGTRWNSFLRSFTPRRNYELFESSQNTVVLCQEGLPD
jgi:hypothetical protein